MKETRIIETADDINIEFFCTRFQCPTDLNICEMYCNRYTGCDQVLEMNDMLKEHEEQQDKENNNGATETTNI